MAKNLRKGSKVFFKVRGKDTPGVVRKKFTARKGELDVPINKRTLIVVTAIGGQTFSFPSGKKLRRRK